MEAEGYGRLCRMEEIILFAQKAGYHKLGLVFCVGLLNEAREVSNILTYHGFEVVSVICKNGGMPKSTVGLTETDTLTVLIALRRSQGKSFSEISLEVGLSENTTLK